MDDAPCGSRAAPVHPVHAVFVILLVLQVCLIGEGPDFFVAVGPHPEWGRAHTVWGEVEDMTTVDLIVNTAQTKPQASCTGCGLASLVAEALHLSRGASKCLDGQLAFPILGPPAPV